MSTFPQALWVSDSHVEPCIESWEEIAADPRGLLLMWEPPRKECKYIMGMDSAEGITGWTRATRAEGDHKVDNGVIEIFRPDGLREPIMEMNDAGQKVQKVDPITKRPQWHYCDVQVAEFAAPCDAVEIARVANVLGRIYAGDAEDQCELIWEAWPGCGMLCTQELLRLGYGNLWNWEYISDIAEETQRLGWRSTRESMKLLWYRARRHLMSRNVLIRSKWLLEEYANAEIDLEKMRARAAYGYHDDRFMAANLAFWGGHKWVYDPERTDEPVTTTPEIDFQRYAPTLGDELNYADWKSGALDGWDD